MIKSVYSKVVSGLKKTRDRFSSQINELFSSFKKIDDELLESLEEILIENDISYDVASELIEQIKKDIKKKNLEDPSEVVPLLQEKILEILGNYNYNNNENEFIEFLEKDNTKPVVILFVGVNGSGKTTTIGKLAHFFKQNNKKVVVAACDTFRAAAIEQLEVWASRTDSHFVAHKHDNADPAAVAFDGYSTAVAKRADFLLIDTAGRLHTKVNLMEELRKIVRVLKKHSDDIPHHTWIVLDGSIGQNSIYQVETFSKYVPISGIIVTKLDGTSHGGVLISIKKKFNIPILLVGIGEQLDDLQLFNPEYYVNSLFEKNK